MTASVVMLPSIHVNYVTQTLYYTEVTSVWKLCACVIWSSHPADPQKINPSKTSHGSKLEKLKKLKNHGKSWEWPRFMRSGWFGISRAEIPTAGRRLMRPRPIQQCRQAPHEYVEHCTRIDSKVRCILEIPTNSRSKDALLILHS